MSFPGFCKKMREHFGITHGVQSYVDFAVFAVTKNVTVNITTLDDWLHKKHGNYEEKGLSMAEFIKKTYGLAAYHFVKGTN